MDQVKVHYQMGDKEGFWAVEGETDRVFVYLFNAIDSIRAGPPLTGVIRARAQRVVPQRSVRLVCCASRMRRSIAPRPSNFKLLSMYRSRGGWRREGGVGEDRGQHGDGWAR